MNRLLDEIMANPEPGHDAISAKLQKWHLPTQTAGSHYEQMNTLGKTAAHDAGLGTAAGSTIGAVGGGYLGGAISNALTKDKTTRLLATLGSALVGGAAGGYAGYKLDTPKDTPTGMSWAQEHGKALTAASLAAAGSLLGGESARLFGDSDNPVYVNIGRLLGGGAGLAAGYALAKDVLDEDARKAWEDKADWKDIPADERAQKYIDFASVYANQKGNTLGGQMLNELTTHPVAHGAWGATNAALLLSPEKLTESQLRVVDALRRNIRKVKNTKAIKKLFNIKKLKPLRELSTNKATVRHWNGQAKLLGGASMVSQLAYLLIKGLQKTN